jgi:hypothetical protein
MPIERTVWILLLGENKQFTQVMWILLMGENKQFIQVMWILQLGKNKQFIQVKVYNIFTPTFQLIIASNSTSLY